MRHAPDTAPLSRRAADLQAPALARAYGDALRLGDAATAEGVVQDALAAGLVPAAIQSLVIAPAMERIGELWQARAITVADEHLATSISQQVLVRLFEALALSPARSREPVLLAAVEGQQHVLGLRMIADVLEGSGYDVRYLGPDVPVGALRDFVGRYQPSVVGLAYAIDADASLLVEAICAVHEASPEARIMLGGRAVPHGLRKAGYPYVETSMDVLPAVEGLLDGPPQELSPVISSLRPARRERDAWPRERAVEEDPVAEQLAKATTDASELAREYVRLAAKYRDLAFRDPVTDLPNRRAFEDRLAARPAGTPHALLMIDVDEFKAVNDAHGHEAGDATLREIARAIRCAVRPQDVAARVGGDEFAVLLPGADLAAAHAVGERLRLAVAEARGLPVAVSVSVGAAEVGADARGGMLAADTALYAAKQAGRDRVVDAV